MAEYKVQLEVFEGPMDLLMHLIEKNEIDIYDIPIAKITGQYLEYLAAMEEFNIEVASEFLIMAATLLQIKSRMLLPRPVIAAAEDDGVEDPRRELVERLLEYRRFKQVVTAFDGLISDRGRFHSRLPLPLDIAPSLPDGLTVDDLLRAIAAVWESSIDDYALISREEITVQDKIQDIIRLARANGGTLEFSKSIIRTGTRSEVVTAFLAMLELIRLRRVSISQNGAFGPIYLVLKE